jgi:CO/xanthine dehydrogenase FAD-binding subunit
MRPFDYIKPLSITEACSVLHKYGDDALVLAGGTDVLIELRRADVNPPAVVIDISEIPQLKSITLLKNNVSIKPLTTHAELVESKIIQRFAPLLSSAASVIGSPQIRNRGTIGGNIMNAATCADTVPPLIALEAVVTLQSKKGKRRIGMNKLFPQPYKTNTRPDELLVDIQFPKLPRNARSSFIKLGRRNSLSISRLSVAAIILQDTKGRITEARIVPGAAFPAWRRIHEAEELLLDQQPSEALFIAAGKKVSEEMIKETGRRWSTEYKEPVIAVLVRRALQQCCPTD